MSKANIKRSLDLRNLSQLKQVVMTDTNLVETAHIQFPNLKTLFADYVQFKSTEWLTHQTELTHLSLENVQALRSRDLQGLTKLQVLDVRGTELDDPDILKQLTSLSSLYIGHTKFSDFALPAIYEKLLHLDVSGLKILNLPDVVRSSRLRLLITDNVDLELAAALNESKFPIRVFHTQPVISSVRGVLSPSVSLARRVQSNRAQ